MAKLDSYLTTMNVHLPDAAARTSCSWRGQPDLRRSPPLTWSACSATPRRPPARSTAKESQLETFIDDVTGETSTRMLTRNEDNIVRAAALLPGHC